MIRKGPVVAVLALCAALRLPFVSGPAATGDSARPFEAGAVTGDSSQS